ncbi:ATP-binding protein [Anaeromicrobium sediminis]|nr:ATP-binding protein [Anaeromicrobium sediminis]
MKKEIVNENLKVETSNSKEVEEKALIKPQRLYESLRHAEYSFESGIGEITDNSIESGANKIWINIEVENHKFEKKGRSRKTDIVKEVAIIDNGQGMTEEVHHKCLVLGETCRELPRSGGKLGIGKFGVGLTLGGISLARRIEVYTRNSRNEDFKYTYIDLDDIRQDKLHGIPKPVLREPSEKYKEYLKNSTGTIIILKKCDRLQYDMVKSEPINASEHISGLSNFIGRTYRKFIYSGIEIMLNEEKVYLHDPLYLIGPTKFDSKDGMDLKAEEKGETTLNLEIPNSNGEFAEVKIKMSLLPEQWRLVRGDGGNDFAKKRKIDKNEGISILRAGREVLYGKVPYIIGMKGTAKYEKIDRFWGCEISFPAELDEYFTVRYIKRGAEPIPSLRDKIRQVIAPVVESLRKEIQAKMKKTKAENGSKAGIFDSSEEIMKNASSVLAKGRKGTDLSEQEADKRINRIINEVITKGENEEEVNKKRLIKKQEIENKPYKIEPVSYPQNIFFETEHILGKLIIKLNINHPFYQKVFVPICGDIENDTESESEELDNIIQKQKIRDAIMLLILSYGKSESIFDNNDDFLRNLRFQWGTALATAINQMEG